MELHITILYNHVSFLCPGVRRTLMSVPPTLARMEASVRTRCVLDRSVHEAARDSLFCIPSEISEIS